jgi:peptide/nickel transport system permease protein
MSAGRPAYFGMTLLGLLLSCALLAPLISPQDPYDLAQLDIMDARLEPGSDARAGDLTYWLGTDAQGRDMLSAILYGLRSSVLVGVAATLGALALGIFVGMFAGYFGGWIDALFMRIADLQLSFPSILIALVLLAILGPGLDKIVYALIAAQWAYYARTMRSAVLTEKNKEYVQAALSQGLRRRRVMWRHLLPNCMGAMLVVAMVQIAAAITLEATLSFLGLGLPITEPSLGLLIANGYNYLLSGKYWISVFPGLALLALILSINLVGDRLRDRHDPRQFSR